MPVYKLGSGENVYVPEFRLSIIAGNQVPLTPLGATEARVGAVLPLQMDGIAAKSDAIVLSIFTFSVCGELH